MYRSSADEPSTYLELTQHGPLTLEKITAMMEPGMIDQASIQGRRVRWSYTSTRRAGVATRAASDALKQLHVELGAAEVIVHRGPWIKEEGEL